MALTRQREGLRDISSLREAYKSKIETARKTSVLNIPFPSTSTVSEQPVPLNTPYQPPPPPEPIPKRSDAAPPGVKTLSSFLDIPKTLTLPEQEISTIWRLRHASNPQSLCAIIPGPAYAHIALMARKHPQFVLPVPREGQGAEMHFLQWTFPHEHVASVLFTSLAEYKLRGEFASPHTTVSLHTELLGEKGLVLAQGTVVDDRSVTVDDGKWLFMCLQKFYGIQAIKENGERRKLLLEQFTSGNPEFKVENLLDEAEKLQ
jgi:ATP synthase F1 complex assembly factor 1